MEHFAREAWTRQPQARSVQTAGKGGVASVDGAVVCAWRKLLPGTAAQTVIVAGACSVAAPAPPATIFDRSAALSTAAAVQFQYQFRVFVVAWHGMLQNPRRGNKLKDADQEVWQ